MQQIRKIHATIQSSFKNKDPDFFVDIMGQLGACMERGGDYFENTNYE